MIFQRTELSNARSIGALIAQLPVMVILPLIIYDENNQPKGSIFIYIVAVMGIIGGYGFSAYVPNDNRKN